MDDDTEDQRRDREVTEAAREKEAAEKMAKEEKREEKADVQTERKQLADEGEGKERGGQPNLAQEEEEETSVPPEEDERRRKAGKVYRAKQTTKNKATIQQVMHEAVVQATDNTNSAEYCPPAVLYSENLQGGEVLPDEDRNGLTDHFLYFI